MSSDEQHLSDLFATLLQTVSEVQETAARVRANGGDCKAALMNVVPEEARGMMELQWPVVSMMLGV